MEDRSYVRVSIANFDHDRRLITKHVSRSYDGTGGCYDDFGEQVGYVLTYAFPNEETRVRVLVKAVLTTFEGGGSVVDGELDGLVDSLEQSARSVLDYLDARKTKVVPE